MLADGQTLSVPFGQVLRALKNILIPEGLPVGRLNLLEMRELLSFSTLYPPVILTLNEELSEALKVSTTFLGQKHWLPLGMC